MQEMSNSFSFHMDELANGIVNCLQEAVENVMPEIMEDHHFDTRLGYGQFRWNPIIQQLCDMCNHLGWIDFNTCSRGSWKVPVIFHPATHFLFTLMSETTFSDVCHKSNKGKHYLCGCAGFNHDVKAQYEQIMLDLPEVSADDEKWVVESQKQLAAAVHADVGDISGHVLVLFDVCKDTLLSVRAVRLTPDLEVSTEEENWTTFINNPYNAGMSVEPQQNCEEDDEVFVTLQ